MGRFVALLLGAGVVFGLGYFVLKGSSPFATNPDPDRKGLQNVRQEAKRIEDDAERRAQETMNKAATE